MSTQVFPQLKPDLQRNVGHQFLNGVNVILQPCIYDNLQKKKTTQDQQCITNTKGTLSGLGSLTMLCLCIFQPYKYFAYVLLSQNFCMGLLCRFHCLCVYVSFVFSLNFFPVCLFCPSQVFFYHPHHHHYYHHYHYYHRSVCFLMREEKEECGFV